MSFDFPIFQINCQKRLVSASILSDICDRFKSFITFITEPYVHAGNLRCLNTKNTRISDIGTNPRAAIYCHRNALLWPVPSLHTCDVAVAIWDTKTPVGCVLLVSVFWDISLAALPPAVDAAIAFAEARGYPVWVAMDSTNCWCSRMACR